MSDDVRLLRSENAALRTRLRQTELALVSVTARAEAAESSHRTLSMFVGDELRAARRGRVTAAGPQMDSAVA